MIPPFVINVSLLGNFTISCTIYVHKIVVMVVRVVVWIELIRAWRILSTLVTYRVALHIGRKKYLTRRMGVLQPFEWDMRDQVLIVHHSRYPVEFTFHELGQVYISNPGLPEVMSLNLVLVPVSQFYLSSCD